MSQKHNPTHGAAGREQTQGSHGEAPQRPSVAGPTYPNPNATQRYEPPTALPDDEASGDETDPFDDDES